MTPLAVVLGLILTPLTPWIAVNSAQSQDEEALALQVPYGFDRGDEEFGIRSIVSRKGYMDAATTVGRATDEAEIRKGLEDLKSVFDRWSSDPDLFLAAYNIACGYSKLKETESAFEWLTKAYELGYGIHQGNLVNMQEDPDLQNVREDPRFSSILDSMVTRYNSIRESWPQYKKAYVRVPKNLEPETRVPACVLFHDFGGCKEDIAEKVFGPVSDALGIILIAPQGPRIIAPQKFNWFLTDGEFLERYRLESKEVWREYQVALKDYPIDPDKVYVAGVGQGATMAFPFALRNPQLFKGILGISGNYWPGGLEGGWAEKSSQSNLAVCLIEGGAEVQTRMDLADMSIGILERAGAKRIHRIRHGGAGLPDGPEMLVDALRWLLNPEETD